MAGVFFAFSAFVMPALRRLPAAQGIAAMQSINKLAVTPAFMTALFGTALACVGLAVWAVVAWGQSPAPWVLAGSALYLAGAIVVTIAANVPLNDALAALHPDGAGAAGRWAGYLSRWTAVEPPAGRRVVRRGRPAHRRAPAGLSGRIRGFRLTGRRLAARCGADRRRPARKFDLDRFVWKVYRTN
jgi:uncharacterized membrane protein